MFANVGATCHPAQRLLGPAAHGTPAVSLASCVRGRTGHWSWGNGELEQKTIRGPVKCSGVWTGLEGLAQLPKYVEHSSIFLRFPFSTPHMSRFVSSNSTSKPGCKEKILHPTTFGGLFKQRILSVEQTGFASACHVPQLFQGVESQSDKRYVKTRTEASC